MKYLILLLNFYFSIACAADYKMIVVTGPGSAVDFVARRIALTFKENNSEHNIQIINMPGALGNSAITSFKTQETILVSNSATHVVNFVNSPDLIQYSDRDFNYVGIASRNPVIWYVNSTSNIHQSNELLHLLKKTNSSICSDTSFHEFHANLFIKLNSLEKRTQYVPFKTSSETLVSILNNNCTVGLTAPNASLLGQVDAKKIVLIGSTWPSGTVIGGNVVPYIGEQFTGEGKAFSGFVLLSLSNKFNEKDRFDLKNKLWQAILDKKVISDINNYGLNAEPLEGNKVQNLINEYRLILQKYLK